MLPVPDARARRSTRCRGSMARAACLPLPVASPRSGTFSPKDPCDCRSQGGCAAAGAARRPGVNGAACARCALRRAAPTKPKALEKAGGAGDTRSALRVCVYYGLVGVPETHWDACAHVRVARVRSTRVTISAHARYLKDLAL